MSRWFRYGKANGICPSSSLKAGSIGRQKVFLGRNNRHEKSTIGVDEYQSSPAAGMKKDKIEITAHADTGRIHRNILDWSSLFIFAPVFYDISARVYPEPGTS